MPIHHGAIFALVLGVVGLEVVEAQDYPTRPIRIIVPYAAGGAVDINARLIAPRLGEILGQPVTVENRPGAGTLIGTRALLQAPPDGYTIAIQATTVLLNTLVDPAAGYRMSDLVPLHPVTAGQFVLSVHESVPAKSVAEFVAYARANPGKVTSASLGPSSITQLSLDRFSALAGIATLAVNFGGSGPAVQAITGGVVDSFLDGAITAIQAAKSGKIRMLAVTGSHRHRLAPEIPTFIELGYPAMSSAVSWTALFASAKTPSPIVAVLGRASSRVINSPELQEKFADLGYEKPVSASEFSAFLDRDAYFWAADLRRAGFALK